MSPQDTHNNDLPESSSNNDKHATEHSGMPTITPEPQVVRPVPPLPADTTASKPATSSVPDSTATEPESKNEQLDSQEQTEPQSASSQPGASVWQMDTDTASQSDQHIDTSEPQAPGVDGGSPAQSGLLAEPAVDDSLHTLTTEENVAPVAEPAVDDVSESAPDESSGIPASETPALGKQPADTANTAAQPGVMTSAKNGIKASKTKRLLIIIAACVIVFGGGAFAFVNLYLKSPSRIWSQALSNTAKGYDQLILYATAQSKIHAKGFSLDGSLKMQQGGASYQGSLSSMSDGNNTKSSLKIPIGSNNIDLEAMSTVAIGQTTPDIYVQFNGIKSFDSMAGNYRAQIDKLDGQWITIGHAEIAQIRNQLAELQSSTPATKMPQLTQTDIIDAAKTFGTVNRQFVLTTDKNKAVTTVVKNYGFETVDGHKTYHYKVGFTKQHVKAYITALRDGLQSSSLGKWLESTTGQSSVNGVIGYDALEASADRINSGDTIDVWVDTSTNLLYKARVSDKANTATNFADFGLNYTGGDSYPFFIHVQSKASGTTQTLDFVTTLNRTQSSIGMHLSVNVGGSPATIITADLTGKPNNIAVTVVPPKNAVPLDTVLQDFGLNDLASNPLGLLGATGASSDLTSGLSDSAITQ